MVRGRCCYSVTAGKWPWCGRGRRHADLERNLGLGFSGQKFAPDGGKHPSFRPTTTTTAQTYTQHATTAATFSLQMDVGAIHRRRARRRAACSSAVEPSPPLFQPPAVTRMGFTVGHHTSHTRTRARKEPSAATRHTQSVCAHRLGDASPAREGWQATAELVQTAWCWHTCSGQRSGLSPAPAAPLQRSQYTTHPHTTSGSDAQPAQHQQTTIGARRNARPVSYRCCICGEHWSCLLAPEGSGPTPPPHTTRLHVMANDIRLHGRADNTPQTTTSVLLPSARQG